MFWWNFIGFGFCIGMATSSAIHGNWDTAALQALVSLINLPYMLRQNKDI